MRPGFQRRGGDGDGGMGSLVEVPEVALQVRHRAQPRLASRHMLLATAATLLVVAVAAEDETQSLVGEALEPKARMLQAHAGYSDWAAGRLASSPGSTTVFDSGMMPNGVVAPAGWQTDDDSGAGQPAPGRATTFTEQQVTDGDESAATEAQTAAAVSPSPADAADNCADATASPATAYIQGFRKWLYGSPWQIPITFVAAATGAACAWDGPRVWPILFVVSFSALAAGAARHEAEVWGVDMISEGLLMAQAAFAIAMASQSGFEGFQVLLGTLLGFAGAYGCGGWVRYIGQFIPGLAILWYSMGAMLGILFFTVWRKAVLHSIGPLFGGYLISASVGLLFSRMTGAVSGQAWPMFPQSDVPWVGVAEDMLRPAGPGALAGLGVSALAAVVIHTRGPNYKVHAIVCLVVMILLTILSAIYGFGCEKLAGNKGCFGWMLPDNDSPWPIWGGFLWGGVTAACAWKQMDLPEEAWDMTDEWQTWWSDSGEIFRKAGYNRLASGVTQLGSIGPKKRGSKTGDLEKTGDADAGVLSASEY